ncbi:retroviral-like aspartic protease family protein [bacterium]|nr:retroviral-like aspartic protease family protein [bacterium]MBP9807856.1 retroviral-like aspartic protease family protein [bacterium]
MKKTIAQLVAAKFSKVVPVFLTALACSISGVNCLSAEAVENKRDQGIKLYNAKNFKDAGVLLDQHLTVYPQDVYALYYDALACQALGNMGKAKIFYRQVATLAPNHQLGGYAKAVLRQIDPSFSGGQSGTSSSSGSSSVASYNTMASASTSTKLDPSIPMEWDVYCTPGDHGVWVDVEIEGRRVKMIFDTGAPTVFIGKNQMEEAGIAIPQVPANSKTGGSSTAGLVSAWNLPMKVKVGQVERTVMVQVVETNHSNPLLGQSYAGLFEYTIDPGAKRIHFKQRGYSTGANRNAYEVPYTFRQAGSRIIVNVEINGKANPCMFDTGNSACGIMFHSPAQAKQYGVQIPDDAEDMITGGVTGQSVAKAFTIRRAKLGPIDRTDLPVTVSSTGSTELPLLGQPFWQGYEYTINQQKKVIEFVRR